jgi:hypothetical protein
MFFVFLFFSAFYLLTHHAIPHVSPIGSGRRLDQGDRDADRAAAGADARGRHRARRGGAALGRGPGAGGRGRAGGGAAPGRVCGDARQVTALTDKNQKPKT